MEYINSYLIFENLQQAKKYVDNGSVSQEIVDYLRTKFIEELNRPNYIGMFTKMISKEYDLDIKELKNYIDRFISLIKNNMKIDITNMSYYSFKKEISKKEVENKVNKILKDHVPNGNIRKEIKNNKKYYNQLFDLVRDDKINVNQIGNKVFYIKTTEDYLKFLESDSTDIIVNGIKDDEEHYEIIEETDEYLFYHQKSYDEDHKFKNTNWCTYYREYWDRYTQNGNLFYILFDKMKVENSVIALYKPKDGSIELYDFYDRNFYSNFYDGGNKHKELVLNLMKKVGKSENNES
jgi:hypothetical protein